MYRIATVFSTLPPITWSRPGCGRDNDVAMAGELAGGQFVEAHPTAARQADQVAALRRIALRRLGDDHEAVGVEPRGVDVLGVGAGIRKASPAPAIRMTYDTNAADQA